MSQFDRNQTVWGQPQGNYQGYAQSRAEYDAGLRSYMLGIYNYMTLGLGVTGLVALAVLMMTRSNPALAMTLYASSLKWVIMLAPLGFVMFMSFRFERMSKGALLGTFLAFAAVMGLSMGAIGLVFKVGSIVNALLITTVAFGGLSLYGYVTKRDLSGVGSFLIMGLIGLIVASLVNLFLQSSMFAMAISMVGVLIFAGLTAWDTQRLRQDYDVYAHDGELMGKASIMGALSLYLNFVNMFQMILSLTGSRND
jgi:hypothetical protein